MLSHLSLPHSPTAAAVHTLDQGGQVVHTLDQGGQVVHTLDRGRQGSGWVGPGEAGSGQGMHTGEVSQLGEAAGPGEVEHG